MSRSKLALFAPALAVASVLFASNAFAIECKADADCGDGFKCEKPLTGGTGVDCPPGADCPQPEPAPDPATITGTCVELPKTCTVDADCGQPYLKCDAAPPPPVACAEPAPAPDGSGGAPPATPDCMQPAPDPNAPKYCSFSPIACAADAECPADWACTAKVTTGGTDCAVPTCPAGQECPAPADCTSTPGETKTYCEPKKVDCVDNSACPSGWTCEVVGGSGCASTGSAGTGTASGSSGGTPTPVPPAPGDCMPTEMKQCIPPGIRGAYGGGSLGAPQAAGDANGAGSPTAGGAGPKGPGSAESGASGAGGSTGSSTSSGSNAAGSSSTAAPAASGDGASSDDGGCSVAHGAASTWPLALALSGLLARIARRRK